MGPRKTKGARTQQNGGKPIVENGDNCIHKLECCGQSVAQRGTRCKLLATTKHPAKGELIRYACKAK